MLFIRRLPRFLFLFCCFFRPDREKKNYLYLHWPSFSVSAQQQTGVCVRPCVGVEAEQSCGVCVRSRMRQVKRVTTHVVASVEHDYEILCSRDTCWKTYFISIFPSRRTTHIRNLVSHKNKSNSNNAQLFLFSRPLPPTTSRPLHLYLSRFGCSCPRAK